MIKKLYNWMGSKVHTPQAPFFLALLSFFESLILPPVAPVLVLFCIENKKKSFLYAGIVTVFSVLGGVVGYYIGFALWETVGQKLVLYLTTQEIFDNLVAQYKKYEALTILIGSFSPVPYRLISISAGFCKLPLLPFILFSLIGRGARYFLIGAVLYMWGNHFKIFIDRWFNQLLFLFLFIMFVGFFILFKA